MASILELEPVSVEEVTGAGVSWTEAEPYLKANALVMDDFESLAQVISVSDADYSKFLRFAFTVTPEMLPDTEQILGFKILGQGYASAVSTAAIDQVRLNIIGGAAGAYQDYQDYLSDGQDALNLAFGDGTSKWGWEAVTPADIRNANFRLIWRVQFFGASALAQAYIDGFKLHVYHELAATYRRRIICTT